MKRTDHKGSGIAEQSGGLAPLEAAGPGRRFVADYEEVYNLALDELIEWYAQEPRPGFSKAVVSAWPVALEARGLGAISINVRITAARKLAAEAADNGCCRRNSRRASCA